MLTSAELSEREAAITTPVPDSNAGSDVEDIDDTERLARPQSGEANVSSGAVEAVEDSENEEEDDDEEEEDEEVLFDESQVEAIPRSDAGALAALRSLGVSGVVPEADDPWAPSEDDEVDVFSLADSGDLGSSFEGSDLEEGGSSRSEGDRGSQGEATASPPGGAAASVDADPAARSPFWAMRALRGEEQFEDGDALRALQRAMRLSGAHVECCAGGALVMAPSAQAREKALRLLEESHCEGVQEAGAGAGREEEDADAEPAESIEISSLAFPCARGMQHECVFPTALEGLIQPLVLYGLDGEFPYRLDPFQQHACNCVARGESVLVAANTSAGKTVVAEYAVARSLRAGRRALYTSPLKALSNQKFVELQRHFPRSVGLMTGDVTLNPDAPVVILTTEVLSTMLYHQLPSQPDLFDSFEWVVFDEAQYIGDERRGTSWEECFIFLPEHLRCVLLTATIPNTHAVANWIARTRFELVHVVTSMSRPVPLKHELFLCGDTDPHDRRHFVPVYRRWNFHPAFVRVVEQRADTLGARHWVCPRDLMGRFIGSHGANLRMLERDAGGASIDVERHPPHVIRVWASSERVWRRGLMVVQEWLDHHGVSVEMPPAGELDIDARDLERLLCLLKVRGRLPLIGFSFEKKQCEQIALTLAGAYRMDFASAAQKRLIDAQIAQGFERLSEEDRKLKQVEACSVLLRRGIGVHHSGMLPFLRELTELLFAQGLLDVVFATDTFAIGLNMPAKTVVFCALSKFDGTCKRPLHAGEFRQMAGRAGRRGIDREGTAVVMARQPMEANRRTVDLLWELYSLGPPEVSSHFRLRWSSLVNMLRSGPAHVGYALDRSFCEGSAEGAERLQSEGSAMERVLRRRSYVDAAGALLPKGEMVARLSVPSDPVFVTEVIVGTRGFAGLRPSQIFALCCCFVGEGPAPKERVLVEDWAVAAALDDARRTASTLYSELVEADLEAPGKIVSFVNARLHPRLANTTLLWADGVSFTEAVQRSGVPVGGEGVLVRTFRRLDELMREVAFIFRHLLGLVDLAQAIQAKREETRRGVLVVPSLYLGEAEDPVAEPIPPSAPLRDCPFASGEVVSLSPLDIGFSHNTCSERFRDTQVSLLTTARSLLFGWVSWAQLPSVRVFWHRGRFYTLANRRLAAARLWALAAEWRSGDAVLVQVRVASEADARRWGWERKFTTGFTQGRSVRISGTHRRVGSSRETTTFGSELWENVAG